MGKLIYIIGKSKIAFKKHGKKKSYQTQHLKKVIFLDPLNVAWQLSHF